MAVFVARITGAGRLSESRSRWAVVRCALRVDLPCPINTDTQSRNAYPYILEHIYIYTYIYKCKYVRWSIAQNAAAAAAAAPRCVIIIIVHVYVNVCRVWDLWAHIYAVSCIHLNYFLERTRPATI